MQVFLKALYDDLPEGAWWYIWTLSADHKVKTTHWVRSVDEALSIAQSCISVHVYYPIAWATARGTPYQRVKADDGILPAGIVGLVADVDFASADKPHAPPDDIAALLLAERFPLRPTYCVHSGHGLQFGWLFKEPWSFDSDAERDKAAELSRAWAYTLTTIASKHSYELDSVHDLPRVMRLPGTTNVKDPARPLPVELRWLDDEQRYNPEDFREYLVEMPTVPRTALPEVDLGADFPTAKHELLMEADPDYKATWQHTRRFERDNSCSQYDWELARYAVWANWSDNEIAALIRENQRQHGNKPGKATDNKYIARTIARARDSRKQEENRHRAAETLEDDHAGEDDRIRALAVRFEIPLTHVQFINGDPALLRLWVGGRPADIPATQLTTQQVFLAQVTSVARFVPRPVAQKEKPSWRDLANQMLAVAEVIDAGTDATIDGALTSVLSSFIEARGARQIDAGELLPSTAPFKRDGYVWFRLEEFAQYDHMHGERTPRRTLVQRLKLLGGEPRVHKVKHRQKGSTTARFYGVPEDKVNLDEEAA